MVGRYISPLAQETHRRLWSDLDDDNEAGILTQVLDDVDDWRIASNGSKFSKRFRRVQLVSASFLHASMRAPNSMYHELGGQWNYAIPALIIGSKFRRDHIITNETTEQPFVHCALYYPANAGTTQLGMTKGSVDASGKGGCHRDDMKKLCFKNNSCSELYNIDCSCDSSKVPPHMIGDHFAELFSNLANDTSFGNFYSRTVCSYPGTEQGLKDMIAASNSLWKQRHGWCRFDDQECETSERKYRGHTECMASKNIMNVEMADGIIIQMPPRIFERQVNLERLRPSLYKYMLRNLQDLHDWGYTELPIVFMEELKGMSPEACRQHWGGEDCQVGYRKEVYTQAFNFSNGACIASPPGCNEVYYFPPDNHTGTCVPILQNKTCLAEKHIMLPAQDQDSRQIVESRVFPRILLMSQMSGIGYLLVVAWLVVLLNMKKIHRNGGRGQGHVASHR